MELESEKRTEKVKRQRQDESRAEEKNRDDVVSNDISVYFYNVLIQIYSSN